MKKTGIEKVWILSDGQLDRLVEIMRRHAMLARQAITTPDERERIIAEINVLERERIELIRR
ncbi:MAG TPA: hypothetical protein GXX63_12195 [Tissierellia bacterium]|nr:hypothetical protein [Tissierellia bacterium]